MNNEYVYVMFANGKPEYVYKTYNKAVEILRNLGWEYYKTEEENTIYIKGKNKKERITIMKVYFG